jgi:catechol 2,3-dioxygenase-like lactoylglutathione lyase family enzyme
MKLDHVVILVADLAQSSAEYRQRGFNVVPGGEHLAFGSHNALIPFADGTYLELATFHETAAYRPRSAEYVRRLAAGDSRLAARWLSMNGLPAGLIDFALIPDSIDRVQQRGIDIAERQMGRARPDGVELVWKMGHPATLDLPFLIVDITPREWRVSAETDHPNGATGISELAIVVNSLAQSTENYGRLLQQDGIHSAHTARFSCGETEIVLTAPHTPALQQHLTERGAGPYQLTLCAASGHHRSIGDFPYHDYY